jgi:predicted N-acetyltransferase YhbS
MNQSMSNINSNSINFIILIGELNYYGQFNFEVNANIYFAINVRQEKILFKKLLDKKNTFSGKIELY